MRYKKKVILFVLLLFSCLIVTSCSSNTSGSSKTSAPEFILRNNIKFGDSVETVKAKETVEIKSESTTELRTESCDLAGVNIKSVVYRFDESGKLVSVLWEVQDSRNTILAPGTFDSLSTSLEAKYGQPDSRDTQSSFLIQGAAISEMMNDEICVLGMMIGKAGPIKQCEWQIESHGNQNVKIELLYYQRYKDDYRVRLSYDMYTDEELDAIVQEKQNTEQSNQNDL